MTRRILIPCIAVALVAVVGVASPAGAAAATKVGLLRDAFGSCSTGAAGGTPTGGFAIIHATASGTVIAELSLKGLTPNHVYAVSLVQTPSGENCFGTEASVTTDAAGNGNVNVHEDVLPGTTGAFVLVQPSDANGFVASSPRVAL